MSTDYSLKRRRLAVTWLSNMAAKHNLKPKQTHALLCRYAAEGDPKPMYKTVYAWVSGLSERCNPTSTGIDALMTAYADRKSDAFADHIFTLTGVRPGAPVAPAPVQQEIALPEPAPTTTVPPRATELDALLRGYREGALSASSSPSDEQEFLLAWYRAGCP